MKIDQSTQTEYAYFDNESVNVMKNHLTTIIQYSEDIKNNIVNYYKK